MATRADISDEELRRRIVYAFMRPVARLARLFELPLKEVGQLLQMAYFHETKLAGMKTPDAAALLDVSLRKLSQLSRLLKDNFVSPDVEKALPRRIEFLLWAEPLGRKRIKQVLPEEDADDIDDALDRLLAEERIEIVSGRTPVFRVRRRANVLVRDDWMSRIDGVNNMLASVTHAVYGRFFTATPHAFARTLTFRVRHDQTAELDHIYEEGIFGALSRLDEAAADDPDAVPLDFSVVWAPNEFLHEPPSPSSIEGAPS